MANIIHRINTSNNYQRGTAIVHPGSPFNHLASGNVLHRNEPFIQTLDLLNASASGNTFALYGPRFDNLDYYHNSAVAFSPLDIADTLFWLDALDITTLWQDSAQTTPVTSNGDRIGYWSDKSVNGFDWVQANSPVEARPFYSDGTSEGRRSINTLPAVHTNHLDGSMLDNEDALLLTSEDVTAFFIINASGLPTGTQVVLSADNGVDFVSIRNTNDGFAYEALGGDNTVGWASTDNPNIFCLTIEQGVEVATRKNGVLGNLSPESTALTWSWDGVNGLFGRRNQSSAWMNAAMGEIILYNRLLTTSEQNQVANYLSTKWSIAWTDIV